MNDLKYYMSLPYRIELIPDEGGVVARVPELPGCMSSGDTAEEALKGLEETKELWLQGRLRAGHTIPVPSDDETGRYSGKFVLRIPKSLHRILDERATAENMSLNSYVLYLLTERHTETRVSRDVHAFYESQRVWKTELEQSGAARFKRIISSGKIFKSAESAFANLNYVPSPPKQATVSVNKAPTKKDFLN